MPVPSRIVIEAPAPSIDGGRFPSKAIAGDRVEVSADVLRDGHDVLRAVVKYRAAKGRKWHELPLTHVDAHVRGDRWAGSFPVDRLGGYEWTIEAWVDPFAAWREELRRKLAFESAADLASEIEEGARMVEAAGLKAERDVGALLAEDLLTQMEAEQPRFESTQLDPPLRVEVDRERARFSTWYELFPRSWGGFTGVREQIPAIAALGFDVLYFPPIHPIGETNRKGRNNTLVAQPDDVGVPYAVGLKGVGGHEALHPELGSFADFEALVATADEHGMDVALDVALNASADHPWLTEHPGWFQQRPDGTLKYAENPPKKYQDIYNFDWGTEDWEALWQAWYEVIDGWVHRGVKVFRVDNPHTKPFPFWEWLIAKVRADHPEVLFLAEAFTKRKVMQELAKLGFNQSYTYFTWKNARWELREYLEELAHGPERDYFRPNFFVNTPDILSGYLVSGGVPAFYVRLLLAGLLSPSYGIYSGFEHYENVPVVEGSEEYLDSEKYELKERALDGEMLPFVERLNAIRREHPALQRMSNLFWLDTENEALLAFAKRHDDDVLLSIVNLDPHSAQEGVIIVPYELGVPPSFGVHDLLSGERYDWHLGRNYVRLDPAFRVAHLFAVS